MSITQAQSGVWCPIANVAEETRFGPLSSSVREGTRRFSGGTKVYCFPPLWGDGYENIKVLGKPRGGRGLIELVMPFRHLTNWRAKLVLQPFVVQKMAGHWDDSDESRRKAENIARWGQIARVCVHCLVEHRNIDLEDWWIYRSWPALAYWDGQPGQVKIVVVSRVHDESGEYSEEWRPAFDANLARLTSFLKETVGVIVESAPTILLGGHLQSTIRFERPSVEQMPETSSPTDTATRLRRLLGAPSDTE